MVKQSAGILAYRTINGTTEVLLVHPGGPYFVRKDIGVWSIPKGEFTEEDPLVAAKREFEEELGMKIEGRFIPLKPVKLKSGKMVYAWAVEANINLVAFRSNTFTIEWPPKTGKMMEYPEVDKAAWFAIDEAKEKINEAQAGLIDELASILLGTNKN